MSSVQRKTTLRLVVASFAAGAGAMMLVGFVAPVAVQTGLSVRDAMAATVETQAPAIDPLDVVAVQAQLAEADRSLAASRAATDSMIARLDSLSNR